MNKIIIIKSNYNRLRTVKNTQIIIQTDNLDDILDLCRIGRENNQLLAIKVSLDYHSLSDIDLREEWKGIPLIFQVYNIGDKNLFFKKLDFFKSLDLRIYLSSESATTYTDLKLMASLGVDCGISLSYKKLLDDEAFSDLASYALMSPVPHASIEPFNYILRHIDDDYNESFDTIYFEDLTKFKILTDDEQILIPYETTFQERLDGYYSHFLNLDDCSKCVSFKICNHRMYNLLTDCQKVMSDVYDYAEMRHILNNKGGEKQICQL